MALRLHTRRWGLKTSLSSHNHPREEYWSDFIMMFFASNCLLFHTLITLCPRTFFMNSLGVLSCLALASVHGLLFFSPLPLQIICGLPLSLSFRFFSTQTFLFYIGFVLRSFHHCLCVVLICRYRINFHVFYFLFFTFMTYMFSSLHKTMIRYLFSVWHTLNRDVNRNEILHMK